MCMDGKSSSDGIRSDLDIADPIIVLSRFPTTVHCPCLLTALLKGSFPSILCFLAEGISNNLCFLDHGFPMILSCFGPGYRIPVRFFQGQTYGTVFRFMALINIDPISRDVLSLYRASVHSVHLLHLQCQSPISCQVRS